MPNQFLDQVFSALADPTRRAVVEKLSQKPHTVSELAQPFKMALPSFMQHLDVLEQCALVGSEKNGRVRTYRLLPQALTSAEGWMVNQRRLWEKRLDQLDSYLLEMQNKTKPSKKEC